MVDKIDGVEVRYFLNGVWIGDKKILEKAMSVSSKSITRYIKDGMPEHKLSSNKLKIFDIQKCLDWKNISKDKTKSKATKKTIHVDIDELDDETAQDLEEELPVKQVKAILEKSAYLRKTVADANIAELKEQEATMKVAQLRGELVDATKLDQDMASQAVLHRTDKTNDEKVLPVILANKSQEEIQKILHDHNQARLEMLDELVNKEYKCDEGMYEIMLVVLDKLNTLNPNEIINKIKG